jgi:hypothetical protein
MKSKIMPKRGNLFENHKPSEDTDILIEMINKNDKIPWTANTCMLQEHHPSYNCDHTINLAQQKANSSTLGFVKNKKSGQKEFADGSSEWKQAVTMAHQWKNKYSDLKDIADLSIPKAYDFRNIGGYDFTGPLRNQKGCGSCYTMGFI